MAFNELRIDTGPLSWQALFWVAANIVATVSIVFTNKLIFSDDVLGYAQISFAAFHFAVTWLCLRTLSSKPFSVFERKGAAVAQMMPLSVAMTLNVIFPNLSLAHSTVAFYQFARVLLTPCVALLNYILYRVSVSYLALVSLVFACAGVAIMSYYDSTPAKKPGTETTSGLGIIFALLGVLSSSLYTVWIPGFREKLSLSSMQLLCNQAPLSAFLLLYFIPWIDDLPAMSEVNSHKWILVLFSGAMAMVVNVSQFFIIAHSGPVTSTVVGHIKTCAIVALSWGLSSRPISDRPILSLLMALAGIFSYMAIIAREKSKIST